MTSSSPARERVRFPGISPRTYEHPADRTALAVVQGAVLVVTLLLGVPVRRRRGVPR